MFKPALAAVILISVVLSGGYAANGSSPVRAADGIADVSILRSDHTINFGKNITFALELDPGDAQIEEIQAIFKPNGPRSIRSYAYPAFDEGPQISASFVIPTSNGSFFPPGTVFTVNYRIVDAAGNEFTTEPFTVEYLNPEFEWERRTESGLTIVYHDRSQRDIDRLFEAARSRASEMAAVFGVTEDREFKAVVINSGLEADQSFPRTTEAAREGHTFVGFAFDQYNEFVLWGVNPTSFVHELSHLMLSNAVPASIATVPAWLNEGLAVYFELSSGQSGDQRLRIARSADDLMPIRNMARVPGQRDDITLFYGKAGSFVEYLLGEFGTEPMTRLFAALNEGLRPGAAVASSYGYTLDSLDAVWTAQKFGGEVPSLVPAAVEVTQATPNSEPAPPVLIITPVAAVEILPQTPDDDPSFWSDFGDWPVIFFGTGGLAAIAYFGARTIRRRT